jgi:hypothetical protein
MGCSDAPDGTICTAEFSGTPGLCMAGECDTTTCTEANCGDGDACTDDVCDPNDGTCAYPSVVCDDFNDCTADSCNPGEGCEATSVADDTPCDGGTCQAGACDLTSLVLPCTEQAVRNAIASGGGPYTFDCDEPTTLTTQGGIEANKAVVVDGEGKLTLDGQGEGRVFDVLIGGVAEVELRGLTVTGGGISNSGQGVLKLTNVTVSGTVDREGIFNNGTMTLTDSTVSGNKNVCGVVPVGGGITNQVGAPGSATLTLINTTVSGNVADVGGGIWNDAGTVTLVNSTVSGNTANKGGGLWPEFGTMVLTNSTVSGNTATEGGAILTFEGTITVTNSLIDGDCVAGAQQAVEVVSNGYNIESPGDTCGFDQEGDQSRVSAVLLDLQPLANNDGPTQTHAITTDSAAFNAGTCEVDEDQRGVTRPQGPACDVGAFELEQ